MEEGRENKKKGKESNSKSLWKGTVIDLVGASARARIQAEVSTRWTKPNAALSVGYRHFSANGKLHNSRLKLLRWIAWAAMKVPPSANSGGRRKPRKAKERMKERKKEVNGN